MEVRSIPMEELYPLLEEQLRRGSARLPVTGSSMSPTLRGGRDLVRLERLQGGAQRGDGLLYRRDSDQYVLHRGLKAGEELICCGDRQVEQEAVRPDQVLAVATAFCRKGTWHETSEPLYRLYTQLWMLLPLRRAAFLVRGALRRLGVK